VANASRPPAAPIMWPVIDFVPLIASECRSRAERSPNTVQIASASRLSPSGVDVPWGLIMSTSSAGTPRRSRAIFIARAEPVPFAIGWIMSQPSAGETEPPNPGPNPGTPAAWGCGAVSAPPAVNRGAACLRKLEILEEQAAGALAQDEPVARLVE